MIELVEKKLRNLPQTRDVRGMLQKCIFVFIGCFLLTACLKVKDREGSWNALTTDPAILGKWYMVKFDEEKKEFFTDRNPDVTVTEIQQQGRTGYRYSSKGPKQDQDIDFWVLDFEGKYFLIPGFLSEDCLTCYLTLYEIKDAKFYVYWPNSDEMGVFLEKNYPKTKNIVSISSEHPMLKGVNEIIIKKLDDETKAILKEMAQHEELWEITMVLSRTSKISDTLKEELKEKLNALPATD